MATSPSSKARLPVSFQDVAAAAERLESIVHRTPVHTSRTLDARIGGSAFLKCEQFQRTGAFKIRGAYNALTQFPDGTRRSGVLTYSSGNHAQAAALAGQLLDIPVTVIMPEDAPTVKRKATEQYGATIVTYDPKSRTREELASELSTERNLPILPPYDHPDVVAGQGTTALELLDQVQSLDMLLVPCGGGGLLSGSAIATRNDIPDCRVIGVEPASADDATRSFASGTLQTVTNPDTVADGARTPYLGDVTFPLVLELVDEMVTVSDTEIIGAMYFLWERMKLVTEPTGALALAALLSRTIEPEGDRVGVILSGGNVDVGHAWNLFNTYLDEPSD